MNFLRRTGRVLKLSLVYDQSVFIENAIDNVVLAAILGGIISFLFCYFSLKHRALPW
jgi:multidrug efflux pump subunit AcrB